MKDYLEALKWAVDIGDSIKEITCDKGAGNLEVLKFLRQNNCGWGSLLHDAVEIGNLEVVKWALENGEVFFHNCSNTIWDCAGKSGNLELIKLLFEIEKPTYDSCFDIGYSAAKHGHLDALKYVLKQQAVRIEILAQQIDATDFCQKSTCAWLWRQMLP